MGSATSSSRSAGNGAGTAAKARAYKPVSTASKFLALFVDLNMSLIFLLPVLVLFALRVISRNNDWNSEIQIYKSALEVCPLSVKALTNYASLVLAEGRKEESVLVAETAVALYIGQRGAYVNLGIAYDRSDMAMKGIRVFEKALQVRYCSMII
jgi:tetratricopeptide (TPR) repeat protein